MSARTTFAARRVLDAVNGDRDEAARLLGWPRKRLDARLLLLHATPAVLAALAERRIKLGHAERLSQLPEQTQEGTLASILAENISVDDLGKRLAAFARELSAAIFDKSGCQGCPHNSDTQASLFADYIAGGRCANHGCYAEKTRAALEARRQELAGRFNQVFLDVEKEPGAHTILCAHGDGGVGDEQFGACKGCARFGALLGTAPGHEGRVTEDVCFDLACHKEKVASYQAIVKADARANAPSSPSAPRARASAPTATNAKRSSVKATPRRVTEEAQQFLRRTAAQIAGSDPRMERAVLLHALYLDAGRPDDLVKKIVSKRPGTERDDVLVAFYGLDDASADALRTALVAHIVEKRTPHHYAGTEMVDAAKAMIVITSTALPGRFKLNEAFLEAHTKAGIESLMREAKDASGLSFAKWYDDKQGKKAFEKLMNGKVKDIIKTILGAGFDFSEFVPNCVSSDLRNAVKAYAPTKQED